MSLLFVFSFIHFSNEVFAQENKPILKFISGDWDGYANKDGTGLYSEIVQRVFSTKYTVQITPVPWARAQKTMLSGEYDGLIGENSTNPCCLIPFVFLDKSPIKAYVLKGKYKNYQGLESLKKQKTAWVKGYNFDRLINTKLNFIEVIDASSGFKMLKAGRIDSLIEYESDYEKNMQAAKLLLNSFDMYDSGISEDIHVVYKKSSQGEKLRTLWDDRMRELFKSGELKALFEKYKFPFPHSKSIVKNKFLPTKS